MDSNDSSQLKPIPSSKDEIKVEFNEIIKMGGENAEQIPRASLLYFITSSMKIQRHSKSAMILLVGSSGSGKSSTINHLMVNGDEIPVAKTNNYKSSTKTTSEYIITFDEPEYEVSDLVLSVIDTPGFNDGDGVEQDVCNIVSVKKYFQTHPEFSSKTKFYPNLVFIVDKANNNRMKGIDSTLSKSLRGVKMLDVVDISHPNLVVILTHACSVGYNNVRKWQETMQEKKNFVSDLVFQTLGVRAPVVLIENNPDDYGLEKNGDFTNLPSGERQPLNLYNACLSLLTKGRDGKEKKDKFGHMLLNAAFTQKKKNRPTNGHEVKAKIARKEPLSVEELKFVKDFTEAAEEGITKSIAKSAMEYISENNIQRKSVKKELLDLVETMNAMGLSDDSKLKRTTISKIKNRHGNDITEHGLQMLEKKFGIKCGDFKSFQEAAFIGQGYNLVTDDVVSSQVLKLSLVDNKQFGLKIPDCAQILKSNETEVNAIHLQRNESSIKSRLSALGLNVNMAQNILMMVQGFDVDLEFGVDLSMQSQEDDFQSSTNKRQLKEVRIAKISLNHFDSKKTAFTDGFLSAVENLPTENIEDENVMKEFNDFFNRFGQFVITSAYVGGSVEFDSHYDTTKFSKQNENSVGGGIGAFITKNSGKRQKIVNQESIQVSKTTSTHWRGGRLDLQVDGTLHSEEKFSEWRTSVAEDPVFLKNKLQLLPIYTLVGMIDGKKGNLTSQVFEKMFYNHDFYRERKDSSTRKGSRKNPNTPKLSKIINAIINFLKKFIEDK
ncbi:uncharacterized protein LOC124443682 [Xenia sp. Carnegie-2017]|uniref:uncharacterized protein LOC124443682 n=1 Tax=Xenia sp. Carnegie-2017 TaxID=2897299 RepID=UPI001F04A673|nr:uncharacterized protein LOC124443682 [Xenia sp. Carnegie-2017]XP_046850123.1 uncharacterized protein LOC124443682 [Xenia sp. Carnegie-2017]